METRNWVSELPPPQEFLLTKGIAYPLRARIEGTGVGAGRLSFDVAAQPPAMQKWSPCRHVYAPHVKGYLQSQRGEFRLESLPGGKTRLVGTTWYHHSIAPEIYWTFYSDTLLHVIHRRVLTHIKPWAESEQTALNR